MRLVATIALVALLADCSGGSQYSTQHPAPPGQNPELVCNTTTACLTALPIPTAAPRRGP